jgi:hypothetical protein
MLDIVKLNPTDTEAVCFFPLADAQLDPLSLLKTRKASKSLAIYLPRP